MQSILPLDDFRKHIVHNPWHFWQLASNKIPALSACDPVVKQTGWQNAGNAGRDDISDAIYQAERILTTHLGYAPGLNYVTETLNVGCPIHHTEIKLDQGKLKKIGTLTHTLISDLPVERQDKDKDGLKEYFEVILSDSTTSPGDIELFFSDTDWLDEWGLDQAQIRPIKVVRTDDSTIKITGSGWLLVKPILYQGAGAINGYDPGINGLQVSGAYDPSDDTKFVPTLGVYKRVWTNLNQIAVTNSNGTNYYNVRLNDNGLETGQFSLARNCQNFSFYCSCAGSSETDITINYLAGDISIDWSKEISRLALAELDKPICGCLNLEAARWQRDRAETTNPTAGFRIDNNLLGNPLGTREGQIYAWLRVKEKRLLIAISN